MGVWWALAMTGCSMSAALRTAKQELEAGNHAEAREQLAQIEGEYADHPKVDRARYLLAQSYQDEGDCTQALGAYAAFLEAYPESSRRCSAFLMMGRCHAERGEDTAARLMYQRASTLECKRSWAANEARRALATPTGR